VPTIFWDILALVLMVGLGVLIWYNDSTRDWRDWLIKFLIIAVLVFLPFFFRDHLAEYWYSSSEGPVDLQQGWW